MKGSTQLCAIPAHPPPAAFLLPLLLPPRPRPQTHPRPHSRLLGSASPLFSSMQSRRGFKGGTECGRTLFEAVAEPWHCRASRSSWGGKWGHAGRPGGDAGALVGLQRGCSNRPILLISSQIPSPHPGWAWQRGRARRARVAAQVPTGSGRRSRALPLRAHHRPRYSDSPPPPALCPSSPRKPAFPAGERLAIDQQQAVQGSG